MSTSSLLYNELFVDDDDVAGRTDARLIANELTFTGDVMNATTERRHNFTSMLRSARRREMG